MDASPLDTPLTAADAAAGLTPALLRALVDNHDRFLTFLEGRVGRREIAEEILQEAYVRGLDRGANLRDGEAATAWFYRLLRNAVIDHHRRRDVERRALEAVASAPEPVEPSPDAGLMDAVCACVGALVGGLKPEYAEALRRVELDGDSVQAYAGAIGITPNNAAVRLHRAREALRRQLVACCGTCAEDRCADCTCEATPGDAVASTPGRA